LDEQLLQDLPVGAQHRLLDGRTMAMTLIIATYLEVGPRRVFAGALDWPGWSRRGRDEDDALRTLVAYGSRYAAAVGTAAHDLEVPADTSGLRVTERLQGNAGTDFGVPGVIPAADQRSLDAAELERQVALLRAAWAAFDAAAEAAAASSAVLRKGPRGGGRELDAIVSHVLGADQGYLRSLGGRHQDGGGDARAEAAGLRAAIVEVLESRARGEPPPRPSRSGKLWPPRYFVRRSAWHALDHAWEIEDRATAPPA
jgi:hypothetical protein